MSEEIDNREVLGALSLSLPYIQSLFQVDAMLAVTDLANFVGYLPGEQIDVKATIGSPVSEKSSSMQAIRAGKPLTAHVPPEVYGIPVRATAAPIRDQGGKIIGALMVGMSTKLEEDLKEIAAQLSAALEQMSVSIHEIAKSAGKLAQTSRDLVGMASDSRNQIGETAKVLSSIGDISELTHIMGINASIEAARAREQGKGFKVIAEEIRKMADLNRRASEQAARILGGITESVVAMATATEGSSSISQQQASATEESAAAIRQLSQLSSRLLAIAQEL